MPLTTNAQLSPRRWALLAAIALAITGGVLLFVNWRHTHRWRWWPVQIPVQIDAGFTGTASFVAQVDEPHEIEVAFGPDLDRADLRTFVMTMDQPSPLDITWSVRQGQTVLASGACHDYLYIDDGYDPTAARVAKMVLNYPLRQGLWGHGGATARGMGRFDCQKGKRYDVRVEVGSSVTRLNAGQPTVFVRVNRAFVRKHYLSTTFLSAGGFAAVGLSVVIFCGWLLTVYRQSIQHR